MNGAVKKGRRATSCEKVFHSKQQVGGRRACQVFDIARGRGMVGRRPGQNGGKMRKQVDVMVVRKLGSRWKEHLMDVVDACADLDVVLQWD